MIDYFLGNFMDKQKILENLIPKVNLNTSSYKVFRKEIEEYVDYETKTHEFKNLSIKLSNKTSTIQNSIHRFYNEFVGNEELGNSNDFTYSNLCNALGYIEDFLECDLSEIELGQSLEYGFNLECPFDVSDFVNNECRLYKYKTHTRYEPYEYKEFRDSQYLIKVYNKGRQYRRSYPLLRIELKFLDKRTFNHKLGIYTLKDLKIKNNLQNIYILMKELISDHLLVFHNIERSSLSAYRKNKLHKFSSHEFWDNLSKKEEVKQKQKLDKLLIKLNFQEHKNTLLELMDSKFQHLINN